MNNRALGVKVSTYLDDASDAVTLDAVAKGLKVAVQNSGYRKTN